jgi:DMSO/TMAO reductase YedYZ molybdopterin-dependent catalytic subunit
MKALFLLPLLLMLVSPGQNPITSPESPSVTVLGFKWFRTRQNVKPLDPSATGPAAPVQEMIAPNKNYQRNARANDPAGSQDPN